MPAAKALKFGAAGNSVDIADWEMLANVDTRIDTTNFENWYIDISSIASKWQTTVCNLEETITSVIATDGRVYVVTDKKVLDALQCSTLFTIEEESEVVLESIVGEFDSFIIVTVYDEEAHHQDPAGVNVRIYNASDWTFRPLYDNNIDGENPHGDPFSPATHVFNVREDGDYSHAIGIGIDNSFFRIANFTDQTRRFDETKSSGTYERYLASKPSSDGLFLCLAQLNENRFAVFEMLYTTTPYVHNAVVRLNITMETDAVVTPAKMTVGDLDLDGDIDIVLLYMNISQHRNRTNLEEMRIQNDTYVDIHRNRGDGTYEQEGTRVRVSNLTDMAINYKNELLLLRKDPPEIIIASKNG
ncbi:hypothetical protein CYMTET_44337 [Cymbomonas tetramitiformis]|uniref:Uncharacterized protein n=1 Tax=Cymbomonas tetramitiformis TaxID=36881 RepID=A0AAE0C0H0_9CHLO|nr:hypothetical protein CYMTET_44337 [Cymbomonas tetramitiformis]